MVDDRAEYMREYRANNPEYVTAQRKIGAARRRAQRRLAGMFREEFRMLYLEELAKGSVDVQAIDLDTTEAN
jgi:hypothetical protein